MFSLYWKDLGLQSPPKQKGNILFNSVFLIDMKSNTHKCSFHHRGITNEQEMDAFEEFAGFDKHDYINWCLTTSKASDY